ncbi:hypothetical protein [Sporosarcina pasteurii]|uniref:Uncharacterized protein n=1 Tax=Sporosarcina pasteurii TaxID=1474 RepID=A0A380BHZ5_SPOPA|nr:hypothetical protein [Sporosarcina pasteurii]MDS9470734.1 hypothetical protein [Sporosarcina pasteurii]QBQ05588.1 hypothetical protein E2C16_07865 [Sporosarcina pasteurii]SUJ01760.1 Uncharacterised protein [Sporosarcina pasteurii]
MSKRKYISYSLLGFLVGLFIIPSILVWLGVPFSFATVLHLIFGEPNLVKGVIVFILTGLIVFFVVRSSYKDYKELN